MRRCTAMSWCDIHPTGKIEETIGQIKDEQRTIEAVEQ